MSAKVDCPKILIVLFVIEGEEIVGPKVRIPACNKRIQLGTDEFNNMKSEQFLAMTCKK